MNFFVTSHTFQIEITRKTSKNNAIERFVFLDEMEYRKKRIQLNDDDTVETIYCIVQSTAVSFEER